MEKLKKITSAAAIVVMAICFYTFLLGNNVFAGKFSNDGMSWYFLAKGIYCSLTMYLLALVLEMLHKKKNDQ
ncbi:MAG: LCI family antimicrobial peptide [Deltaproteobacteria bacterium]|nr:LCI family antimicrobial peptide [Deltaproteobacteria bacterium]